VRASAFSRGDDATGLTGHASLRYQSSETVANQHRVSNATVRRLDADAPEAGLDICEGVGTNGCVT
jgi:hypothetical protein